MPSYGKGEILTFSLHFIAETDLAIGCSSFMEVDEVAYWLPKSRIEYDGFPGDMIDVQMPRWLADAKGLEE